MIHWELHFHNVLSSHRDFRKRKLSFSPDNHRGGGPASTDNWPLGAPGQAVTCSDRSFLTNVRNRFVAKLLSACCCGQALTATDWAGWPVVSAHWARTRPDPPLQCTVGMHPDPECRVCTWRHHTATTALSGRPQLVGPHSQYLCLPSRIYHHNDTIMMHLFLIQLKRSLLTKYFVSIHFFSILISFYPISSI